MAGGRHDHPQDQHRLQDRGWRERLHGAVSEFFEIEQRGSTVAAEVRAGLVSFLTMSYILLVNPQILSQVRTAPLMLAPAPQANDRIDQLINQSIDHSPLSTRLIIRSASPSPTSWWPPPSAPASPL